jgi:hypothetical protein
VRLQSLEDSGTRTVPNYVGDRRLFTRYRVLATRNDKPPQPASPKPRGNVYGFESVFGLSGVGLRQLRQHQRYQTLFGGADRVAIGSAEILARQ